MTETNWELLCQDLITARNECLRVHNDIAREKNLCGYNEPFDHQWLVRKGTLPVKNQKCCCGRVEHD